MSEQVLIAGLILALFSVFMLKPRWMLTMFLVSFSIPLDIGLHYFFSSYYAGKSSADIRLAFIDFTFLMLVLSIAFNRRTLRKKNNLLTLREINLIVSYIGFSALSCFWAYNCVVVFAEVLNLLKISIIFIYFTRINKFISRNLLSVVYGLFGYVFIEFAFCVVQVFTGRLVNFDMLLGYESLETSMLDAGWSRYGTFRAIGTMGPGEIAWMFAPIVALMLFLTVIGKESVTKFSRRIILCTFMLSTFSLFLTQNRAVLLGSLLGFSVITAAFLVGLKERSGLIAAACVVPIVIGSFSLDLIRDQSEMIAEHFNVALDFRGMLSKNAVEILRENPILAVVGAGQNNYLLVQSAILKSLPIQMAEFPVHNIFLLELVETGLIGCSLFFLLWFSFAKPMLRELTPKQLNAIRRCFALVFIFMTILVLVSGSFSWAIFRYYPRCFYAVILAIILSITRQDEFKELPL